MSSFDIELIDNNWSGSISNVRLFFISLGLALPVWAAVYLAISVSWLTLELLVEAPVWFWVVVILPIAEEFAFRGCGTATTQCCVATTQPCVVTTTSTQPTTNCGVRRCHINGKFGLNGVARPRIGLKLTYVQATPLRNALEASPGPPGPPRAPRA